MTKIFNDLGQNNHIIYFAFGHYHHHIEEKHGNCNFRCFIPLELYLYNE